jgi:magnesium chelatase subunit D
VSALYPFSAVVGLDDLRLALVVNAVSPAVGGVLVRGEKGTVKSTVVRALAALLPPVPVADGCRFSCDPAGPGPGLPGRHPPRRRDLAACPACRAAGRRRRGPPGRLAGP